MKIKFNWGTGIFIAIILFMSFILSFVYKTIAIEKYQHHLISEDYYQDELHYQEEIDKLNNAQNLDENVKLKNSEKGIHIVFPKSLKYKKIKGMIMFIRLSNEQLDFKKTITLNSNTFLIPDNLLVSGKWQIKVYWQYEEEEYLLKEDWFY